MAQQCGQQLCRQPRAMCAIFSRDRYVKLLSDTLAFREYQHTLLCNEAIVAVAVSCYGGMHANGVHWSNWQRICPTHQRMRPAGGPNQPAAAQACPRRCVSSSQRLVRASAAVQSTYSKQERVRRTSSL